MEGRKDLCMADTDTCRLGDWRHPSSLFFVLLCCSSVVAGNTKLEITPDGSLWRGGRGWVSLICTNATCNTLDPGVEYK